MGRWIYKRRGYAITVTSATTRIIPVIARVIPARIMTEYGRCPALRRMTDVAFKGRIEMARRLADRGRAIVAGFAIAIDSLMIECAADESRCRMAEVAVQGGGHMILCLACCRHTMAGLTIIHDAGVIEHRAGESAGVMADTAILIGDHMPGTLTLGEYTIMTGLTVVNDPDVIKRRRQESCCDMTIAAICIGRYMIAGLADGQATVVAGNTVVCNALMVETCACKSCRIVANGAVLSGWNMGR